LPLRAIANKLIPGVSATILGLTRHGRWATMFLAPFWKKQESTVIIMVMFLTYGFSLSGNDDGGRRNDS